MAGGTEAIQTESENTFYIVVWAWLVFLLVAGLAIFLLPIPKTAAVTLIFGVAAVKAILVARNYMHLKHEYLIIYLIALIPIIFFVGFALTLIPDIVYRHHLGG
jgi:caa(3)-type oxidase subunit IV